jgi:hypothetical protein
MENRIKEQFQNVRRSGVHGNHAGQSSRRIPAAWTFGAPLCTKHVASVHTLFRLCTIGCIILGQGHWQGHSLWEIQG